MGSSWPDKPSGSVAPPVAPSPASHASAHSQTGGAASNPVPASVMPSRFVRPQSAGPAFIDLSRRWAPTAQAMMVDAHKLAYLPIAKNACSSTKRLVASLGGVHLKDGEDIHQVLDFNDTGIQFKDRTPADIKHALSASDWMRFMIFRDPMDRLISAYVEKFVNNREDPVQWGTCTPVIQRITSKEKLSADDYARGITFREFAEFVMDHNPADLDSHWQPQIYYMGHVPLTHMYDVKNLDLLEIDLRAHVGTEVALPHLNRSRDTEAEKENVPEAVDLLPPDLPNAKSLTLESFLPRDLRQRLMEYYAADLSLYHQIQYATQLRRSLL